MSLHRFCDSHRTKQALQLCGVLIKHPLLFLPSPAAGDGILAPCCITTSSSTCILQHGLTVTTFGYRFGEVCSLFIPV